MMIILIKGVLLACCMIFTGASGAAIGDGNTVSREAICVMLILSLICGILAVCL